MVGLTLPQASCCIAAGALFWLGCCCLPKTDAKQSIKDPDANELVEDSCVSTASSN